MSSLPLTDGPTVRTARPERSAVLDGVPDIPDPRTISTTDARALSLCLFRRLSTLEEGTEGYSYVRNTLVELNLSLVKFAAARFHGRSEPMEDIVQVGTVGLIKAINRFDVERDVEFSSFALPTVIGEIKRFFRDTSWAVRVPRRLQELRLDLAKASDALEQELGRPSTTAELAAHLGITPDEVVEGQRAANGYLARSLEPFESDETTGPLGRRLGAEDPALDIVECLECLKPMIAGLPERERTILRLRFGEELTQSEIGERLGISQMHVSRLLSRVLTQLREGLLADDGMPCDEHERPPSCLRPLLRGGLPHDGRDPAHSPYGGGGRRDRARDADGNDAVTYGQRPDR